MLFLLIDDYSLEKKPVALGEPVFSLSLARKYSLFSVIISLTQTAKVAVISVALEIGKIITMRVLEGKDSNFLLLIVLR